MTSTTHMILKMKNTAYDFVNTDPICVVFSLEYKVAPTVRVIWWLSSFTGGGTPKAYTYWVEQPTFPYLAVQLPQVQYLSGPVWDSNLKQYRASDYLSETTEVPTFWSTIQLEQCIINITIGLTNHWLFRNFQNKYKNWTWRLILSLIIRSKTSLSNISVRILF